MTTSVYWCGVLFIAHCIINFYLTGGDDQRILVWKMSDLIQGRQGQPPITMTTKHRSNIFTIDFSCDNSYVFTGSELGGNVCNYSEFMRTSNFHFPCMGNLWSVFAIGCNIKLMNFTNHYYISCHANQNGIQNLKFSCTKGHLI